MRTPYDLTLGLHELAQRLAKKMRMPNVEFKLGDVREAEIPEDTRVVYIASTVFGPDLMYQIRHDYGYFLDYYFLI